MNRLKENLPETTEEARWEEYVQQKAHAAILIELKDYDWGLLDPETARRIHAMLDHR